MKSVGSAYTDTLLSKYIGSKDRRGNMRRVLSLLAASISSESFLSFDWKFCMMGTVSSAYLFRISRCSQLPSSRGIRKPVEELQKYLSALVMNMIDTHYLHELTPMLRSVDKSESSRFPFPFGLLFRKPLDLQSSRISESQKETILLEHSV